VRPLTATPIRRTIVFDSAPVEAKMLRFLLTEYGHHVVVADRVTTLVKQVLERETFCVILDADSNEAIDAARELRGEGYSGPLILLSRSFNSPSKLSAFDAGADDFVIKPFDPLELIARIQSIVRRCLFADRVVSANLIRVGDAELAVTELTFNVQDQRRVVLTPTEMRLLECLMRNPDRTITRDTLLRRTWPHDAVTDPNRVDVYVGRLRKKVEPDPRHPTYIQTKKGVGYAFKTRVPEREPRTPGRNAYGLDRLRQGSDVAS
jgi:two-component system, OmpR family, response regulator RegX3